MRTKTKTHVEHDTKRCSFTTPRYRWARNRERGYERVAVRPGVDGLRQRLRLSKPTRVYTDAERPHAACGNRRRVTHSPAWGACV